MSLTSDIPITMLKTLGISLFSLNVLVKKQKNEAHWYGDIGCGRMWTNVKNTIPKNYAKPIITIASTDTDRLTHKTKKKFKKEYSARGADKGRARTNNVDEVLVCRANKFIITSHESGMCTTYTRLCHVVVHFDGIMNEERKGAKSVTQTFSAFCALVVDVVVAAVPLLLVLLHTPRLFRLFCASLDDFSAVVVFFFVCESFDSCSF